MPRLFKLMTIAMTAAVAMVFMVAGSPQVRAQDQSIIVFAAVSMKNALDDINVRFIRTFNVKVIASYAASAALIKQIEQGAPASVYASADRDWMDYGMRQKMIRDDTRVDLLGNRLVLIVPKDSAIGDLSIAPGLDLVALAGGGRIVTGDVRAVPVGKYAKAALQWLGAWPSVEQKLATVENVRAALTLVARGEAGLGIVYETDARIEPNVRIVGRFPPEAHPPIVYPVALTTIAKPAGERYLAFLRSQAAQAVFESFGFAVLLRPAS